MNTDPPRGSLAMYVTTVVTATLLLLIGDTIIDVINILDRATQVSAIQDALSSTAAENRITARRLEEYINHSKERWDFLQDKNPTIDVPSSIGTPPDLQRTFGERPTLTATPTPSPKPIQHHGTTRRKVRPTPTPWFHFFKSTR